MSMIDKPRGDSAKNLWQLHIETEVEWKQRQL
jgi:hypothetical protein